LQVDSTSVSESTPRERNSAAARRTFSGLNATRSRSSTEAVR
jgi:hypothetical protein